VKQWCGVFALVLSASWPLAVFAEPITQQSAILTRLDLLSQTTGNAQTLEPAAVAPEVNDIYTLDTVAVTANRRSVPLKESTSTIYVVDRKEIERKAATNVGEAIRGVLGDPARPLLNDAGEPQFELTRLNTQSHLKLLLIGKQPLKSTSLQQQQSQIRASFKHQIRQLSMRNFSNSV
jgi:hypothetical protein